MDYTPGIFQMDVTNGSHVNATIANQLALYVTMYSPLQMAADFPENYEKVCRRFPIYQRWAVDWDESKYLKQNQDNTLPPEKLKVLTKWFVGNVAGYTPIYIKIS